MDAMSRVRTGDEVRWIEGKGEDAAAAASRGNRGGAWGSRGRGGGAAAVPLSAAAAV